ncbi:MAG TPA: sigma-70 family RNA polymerase sigma factor [Blastocatellia bacterium]|nr:sigma-70 family RNA polymerase sigma factor [Blastocatellia bacterium]
MGPPRNFIATQTSEHDFVALLGHVADGDQSALTTLYDATSRLVFGLVLRILSDRSAAEEVLLDVYTQVWRQASTYDSKRGAPLAWMMTIARSRAIDRLRAGRQEHQHKEPIETVGELRSKAQSPEEATEISERQKIVREALDTLSAEQREVLELAYFSGLSHSEIALKLGQPLGTVKTRTRLGMMKLRELLKPVLGGNYEAQRS